MIGTQFFLGNHFSPSPKTCSRTDQSRSQSCYVFWNFHCSSWERGKLLACVTSCWAVTSGLQVHILPALADSPPANEVEQCQCLCSGWLTRFMAFSEPTREATSAATIGHSRGAPAGSSVTIDTASIQEVSACPPPYLGSPYTGPHNPGSSWIP